MPATGSPLGSTPFGVGTPATANVPPAASLRFSRYINPGSGDYEVDAITGQLKQMPPTRQRMLLIMRTVQGSSSVQLDLGIVIPPKIDRTFAETLKENIRTAYDQLTRVEKVARIDDIIVEVRSTGRVETTIVYEDLVNEEQLPADPLTIPLTR